VEEMLVHRFPDAEMSGGSYFLYRANGQWIPHGYLFYRKTRKIEGRKHCRGLGLPRRAAA